jgi:hypothetical protein
MRQWSAHGQYWLVRVKAGSSVQFEGQSVRVGEVAQRLKFRKAWQVRYKGKPATQWIASAPVVLARKAKPKRNDAEGKRVAPVPGDALALRLVVSCLLDARAVAFRPPPRWTNAYKFPLAIIAGIWIRELCSRRVR